MPYTPEQIQAALAQYQQATPLSSPEGTWAAPATAPMAPPSGIDTSPLSPEAPSNPDWMAVARSYGQPQAPAGGAPDQETGLTTDLAVMPTPSAPSTPQESLAAIRDSSVRAADAERARGEAQAQGFERQAQLADQQLADMTEQQLAQQEQRRIRDEKYNALFSDAQKRSDEAANMAVYDRRTTGQLAAGAIGLALAAIGDGFNRMGGNTQTNAIGMISQQLDRQLERDLQLQREAIEDKRKAAAAKFSELGIARQMNLDANGQDEMANVFLLRKQAAAMKSLAASTQAADARALAEQAAAEREAKATQLYDAILDRNANTQANTAYKEGLVRAQRSKGGAGGGTQGSSFETIAAKIAAGGGELSTAELKIANSKAYTDWVKGAKSEGQEIIPGFVQDENVAPLTQGEINDVRKQYRSARGVQFLTEKLADLWAVAVDPKTSSDARTKARTEYAGYMADLQAGKSVQTGQGTITEGDAKRLAATGTYPELPTNWLGAARTVDNYVRDKDPGAASIREIGNAAIGKIEAELMDTYGIRRRANRPAEQPAPAQSGQVQRATSAADLD